MFKRVLMGASALLLGASGAFADDSSELAAMKASLEKLQGQMAARDAQVSSLQRQLDDSRINDRMNAGGEPAALQSANGKAALTIGGQVRVRYTTEWASAKSPSKTVQSAAWALNRVELNFGLKLSDDTKALISIRPEGSVQGNNFGTSILNQAYWDWSNIGGTGLGLRVGYQYVPFGGWTGEDGAWSWDGTLSGGVYPFVGSNARKQGDVNYDYVPAEIGAVARYKFLDDQVVVKAGILSSDLSVAKSGANPGVNSHNELRNIGLVNHVVNVAYNPCWIEGLHLEAGYWGKFDDSSNSTGTVNSAHAANYSPQFEVQAYYKTAKWKFVAEWTGQVNPYAGTWKENSAYYADGFANVISGVVRYNVTDKWVLSGGADYARLSRPEGKYSGADFADPAEAFQLHAGTDYTFSNGIIAQLGYRHLWTWNKNPGTSNTDSIVFQTAYKF
ncbi:MAG: OprO/OprP family phosphate-selective porin [Planctomycetota bacterium]|jgi:hypothetical protein|nr:OprO/OprP family phosphate-selective porin [Planctomycetota bacterium]